MSKPANDLPPEAAAARPLTEAFRIYADRTLVREYHHLEERLEREGRRVYVGNPGNPGNPDRIELDPYYDRNLYLLHEMRSVMDRIDAGLLARLGSGEVTGWGREGSPLAAWRQIPAAAWTTLRFDDLQKGTVTGPGGVMLYDVRIGPRLEVPKAVPSSAPQSQPASGLQPEPQFQPYPEPVTPSQAEPASHPKPPRPTTGAPGKPSNMHFVEMEFERRRNAGQLEPSLTQMAKVLSAWFKQMHPDKQPIQWKSIYNRFAAQYREAKRKQT